MFANLKYAVLMAVGLAITVRLFWNTFILPSPSAQLPEHLVSQTIKIKHDPMNRICTAYATLANLNHIHFTSPQLFYTLLQLPTPATSSTPAERKIFEGRILAKLDAKVSQLWKELEQSTSKRDKEEIQKWIAVWNKIGAVLLTPEERRLYDAVVVAPVLKGMEVASVLNGEGVCLWKWEELKMKAAGE